MVPRVPESREAGDGIERKGWGKHPGLIQPDRHDVLNVEIAALEIQKTLLILKIGVNPVIGSDIRRHRQEPPC